jgi:hypothetical protein
MYIINTVNESKLANLGKKDKNSEVDHNRVQLRQYFTSSEETSAMAAQTGPSRQTVRGLQHAHTGKNSCILSRKEEVSTKSV